MNKRLSPRVSEAFVFFLLGVCAIPTYSVAQTFQSTEVRSFIAEYQYVFNVRNYAATTDYELSSALPKSIDRTILETTALHFFQTMARGEFDANEQMWSPGSRLQLQERDKQAKKTRDDWIREWREFYSTRTLRFLRRADIGAYAILEYETFHRDKAPIKSTLAFARIDGKWYATNELADDPTMQYWSTTQRRVQAIPSILTTKPR